MEEEIIDLTSDGEGALEFLASALNERPPADEQASPAALASTRLIDTGPHERELPELGATADLGEDVHHDATPREPVDPSEVEAAVSGPMIAPPGSLRGFSALPLRLRRRIQPLLCEGEEVDCVVEGGRNRWPRYVVATTHRIILVGWGSTRSELDTLSLPWHRTDPAEVSGQEMTLRYSEFGNSTSAVVHPRDGYEDEVAFVLTRLAAG